VIIEVDRYYNDRHGVYRWSSRGRDLAWKRAFTAFDRNLRILQPLYAVITVGVPGSGKSRWALAEDAPWLVVFDGVFANPMLRRHAVDIARRRDTPLVAAWFLTPWDVCVARNDLQGSDRRVPTSRVRHFWNVIAEYPPRVEHGYFAVEHVTSHAPPLRSEFPRMAATR
jgi:hypothetical protein